MSRVKGRAPRPRPAPAPVGRCVDDCGACCDPVALPYTQAMVARARPGEIEPANRRWVLEDLTPMSRREGLAKAPYMSTGVTIARDNLTGEIHELVTQFYSCRHYDPDSRRCTAYNRRPPICRDFPWYGMAPDPTKALPDTCGHLIDIGVTPVPIPTRRT